LYYLTPVIPIIMLEQVGSACLRGAGDTVTGLVARAVVNIVNAILSALLVTGSFGFPHCGRDGLAIGTAVGHAFGGLIVLAALCRGRNEIQLERSHLRPDWPLMRRLLRVGIPGGTDMLIIVFCHMIYLRIINELGDVASAAHGLSVQIEAMSFLTASAFQVAAATMAGQSLGARDPQRAKQSVWLCCGAACFVMLFVGTAFYFGGETIAVFFTKRELNQTSELSGQLLKIVAVSVVPTALLIVLSGALRGAGDTRFNLVMNIVGVACIRLPLSVAWGWDYIQVPGTDVFVHCAGWGVQGVWWAMVTDVSVRCVIFLWRFVHGGWMKVQV
jgi:putative MATE family efflux protein